MSLMSVRTVRSWLRHLWEERGFRAKNNHINSTESQIHWNELYWWCPRRRSWEVPTSIYEKTKKAIGSRSVFFSFLHMIFWQNSLSAIAKWQMEWTITAYVTKFLFPRGEKEKFGWYRRWNLWFPSHQNFGKWTAFQFWRSIIGLFIFLPIVFFVSPLPK
jgi:hypothetical protein